MPAGCIPAIGPVRSLLGLTFALLAPMVHAACGDALPAGPRLTAQTPGWELVFLTRPAPLVSGKPLVLDLQVCSTSGQPAPARLVVDADMPAHKHGMNYRPTVRSLGEGRFEAQGLLLHMPGRWRFLFDLQVAGGPAVRLEHWVDIR